jgi:DnaJ family protein C protein 28
MSRSKRDRERLERLKLELEERQLPAEESSETARARREQDRADLIEQRIQEAMANGEFDNLRGKGKPLPSNTNPYLDRSQELAFGLLQNNNFAPEWIERDKEIRRELATAREHLGRAWQHYQANPADEATWQAAVSRFEERLIKLNRQIDHFNLIVPIPANQRFRLRLENEIRRVQNSI